jgi:hypothetical protein
MFSLGTEGTIISNSNIDEISMNPTKVILDCLSSILEVLWIINSDSIPINRMDLFQFKINYCNSKLLKLWEMFSLLCEITRSLKVVKIHLCTHLVHNWLEYGSIKSIDTAIMEHTHIADRLIYSATSKRDGKSQIELLNQISYQLKCDLHSSFSEVNEDEVKLNDCMNYSSISNRSKIQLVYQKNSHIWATKGESITSNSNFFHPLLTLQKFTNLLTYYWNDMNYILDENFNWDVIKVYNIQAVKIKPNLESE